MAGQNKVIKYRKPIRINVGVLIFVIMFIYMCFFVYSYLSHKAVYFYEVTEGAIVDDTEYTGLILRSEEVQSAPESGYINYFIREGRRVPNGSNIYSLDSSNNVKQYLEEDAASSFTLSESNLKSIKRELSEFSLSYNDLDFSMVYDAKASISANISEFTSTDTLNSFSEMAQSGNTTYVVEKAPSTGVISFIVDSYEGRGEDSLTSEDFNKAQYQPKIIKSGELVASGTPIYKIINSENWYVYFKLTNEDKKRFEGKTVLNVEFQGSDFEFSGSYSELTGSDGASYGKIAFNKFMIQYENERFVNFRIKSDNETGLKIPLSSVVEKQFYKIPKSYTTKGGNSVKTGFNKEVYDENGASIVFVPAVIYYSDDDFVYIEALSSEGGALQQNSGDFLKSGDNIVMPESTAGEKFQIGETAPLKGVYYINKGFAVFKHIEIIASNDEYLIIKKNTEYGLSVYDHILIDTSKYSEGDFIY